MSLSVFLCVRFNTRSLYSLLKGFNPTFGLFFLSTDFRLQHWFFIPSEIKQSVVNKFTVFSYFIMYFSCLFMSFRLSGSILCLQGWGFCGFFFSASNLPHFCGFLLFRRRGKTVKDTKRHQKTRKIH